MKSIVPLELPINQIIVQTYRLKRNINQLIDTMNEFMFMKKISHRPQLTFYSMGFFLHGFFSAWTLTFFINSIELSDLTKSH